MEDRLTCRSLAIHVKVILLEVKVKEFADTTFDLAHPLVEEHVVVEVERGGGQREKDAPGHTVHLLAFWGGIHSNQRNIVKVSIKTCPKIKF